MALGVPLGLVTARFKWAGDTIGVLGLGLQTLPSVCWVPLALLWFGQTESAMQFVVIMGTLWSVQISTDNGVRNVPPIYQRAAKTMGSRGLHTWIHVNLPASLPFIVSGVKGLPLPRTPAKTLRASAFADDETLVRSFSVKILRAIGRGRVGMG